MAISLIIWKKKKFMKTSDTLGLVFVAKVLQLQHPSFQ